MADRYPRDMRGYGPTTPDAKWPGQARIALQFVVNYEEGGENCLLHGDAASEAFLSEIIGAAQWPAQRHWNMESIYEYGARAGFWRLHRLFTGANIPVTVYGVTDALARGPDQVAAMQDADWEIASHGLKWIEYKDFSPERERDYMQRAIKLHTEVTGTRPRGWYLGRCTDNTIRLAAEEGGFAYLADAYDDDLPYWKRIGGRDQLIIPYTLDVNDSRFVSAQGFNSSDQYFCYLRDSFDALYAEGGKMMSIGLHCRLIGRPGRIQGLRKFIQYAQSKSQVWFARRIDIAEHWSTHHPAPASWARPSEMDREAFAATYGSIFEHSAWVAEEAYELELGPAHDSAVGVHSVLCRTFRAADQARRLAVLTAHPDLAGKLAVAKQLTDESTAEQASAGLDVLSDAERLQFSELNSRYTTKFGFPFIIAVKDNSKKTIMAAFKARLENDRDTELATACRQVERIAWHRLKEILP